jgi:hypothetical protein
MVVTSLIICGSSIPPRRVGIPLLLGKISRLKARAATITFSSKSPLKSVYSCVKRFCETVPNGFESPSVNADSISFAISSGIEPGHGVGVGVGAGFCDGGERLHLQVHPANRRPLSRTGLYRDLRTEHRRAHNLRTHPRTSGRICFPACIDCSGTVLRCHW